MRTCRHSPRAQSCGPFCRRYPTNTLDPGSDSRDHASVAKAERTLLNLVIIIALSLAGAVAVVSFLVSLFMASPEADSVRLVAYIAAGVCAALGVLIAALASKKD